MKSLCQYSALMFAAMACVTGCETAPALHAAGRLVSTPRQVLTITSTEEFTSGKTYGAVGAYEKLTGVLKGEIDPREPKNAIIQDLALAPVNERGMVEYSADFVMLKPKDMSRASGVLRYDAPNRGNIITMINPAVTPGDAVFLERGYVILYSAWQGDVPKSSPARLTLTVPVARNPDGSSITGSYRTELIPLAATPSMLLPGGTFNESMRPYAPATIDNTQPGFSLTKRINETDPRMPVPARDWTFANCDTADNPFPGKTDPARICVRGGFAPDYMYELVYIAKDPLVLGVGLAALRETVTFFRARHTDANGDPNPVADKIKFVIGQGTSQSGNTLKTFIHLGFNQALDGSKVFDGAFSHVASRQTNINMRFAVPGGGSGLRTDHTAFGQSAPRGLDKDYFDEVAGRKGGVMTRCALTNTCPKFFLGLSGSEFWQLQVSPVLTDANGTRDLSQPENARIYYYSSTQHGGTGGTNSVLYRPARDVYPSGTVAHFSDTFRALFVNLEDWVRHDTLPPPSQVPMLSNGTLVRPDQVRFPQMKGVSWAVNGVQTSIPAFQYLARHNDAPLLDFGPHYKPQDESGIATVLPPTTLGKKYAILVPQVSPSTGLTMAGIRGVEVQAPLGTSIEFNYKTMPGIIDLTRLTGAFIPFHKTESGRRAGGDTRPSLESLYGDQAGYVAAVRSAADLLVEQRFLLRRDADRLIGQAAATVVLP